jgi:hypothetical protein
MEKINIAASQNDNGLFNLVISKVTNIPDQEPVIESIVKTGLTLDEVKTYINGL